MDFFGYLVTIVQFNCNNIRKLFSYWENEWVILRCWV